MIIKNVTEKQLETALARLNEIYNDNIKMFTEYIGKTRNKSEKYRVNLRVKDASKNGVGRKINQSWINDHKGIKSNGSTCWHVHGNFFDILLNIESKAIIQTQYGKIYKDSNGSIIGNWEDQNIGSLMLPIAYSELCECLDNKDYNIASHTWTH
jgi:hypothetical protein